MAQRPIFSPDPSKCPYVRVVDVDFQWHPGFAKSQLQRSIESLHEAAEKLGIAPILEISRKSSSRLGASLSAFNLKLKTPNGSTISVECAYQGSKVFQNGGPFRDLYFVESSRAAKTDLRLSTSGALIKFDYFGEVFPTEPKTAFYDWLYINALWQQDPSLARGLARFEGFSDIVFNPKRSFNCQARAAALFVSLSQNQLLNQEILEDKDDYMALVDNTGLLPIRH